jgi:hypothetical protein
MPTSGKIFLYREKMKLADIKAALEGYRVVEEYDAADGTIPLVKDVYNLILTEDELYGTYAFDAIRSDDFRGHYKETPYTTYAPFYFFMHEERPYCLILASKSIANNIANELSTIVAGESGVVAVPVLDIPKITKFYQGGQTTKVLLMDNMTTPNMSKMTMYGGEGGNIVQTDLYGRYVDNGDPWYVVFKERKTGATVGLVRDGTLVIFSEVDEGAYLNFIKDNIIPLVLRRGADE